MPRYEDLLELEGNNALELETGSYDEPRCLEALEEADVVITNPPFSLYRPILFKLMEEDKTFLLIGNMNSLSYGGIFPLLKDNRMWPGVNGKCGTRKGNSLCFRVPATKELKQVSSWWFTNMDHEKRHEELKLTKLYDPELYPKYDNYDAIEVSRSADIPVDYLPGYLVPREYYERAAELGFDIVNYRKDEYGNDCVCLSEESVESIVGGSSVEERIEALCHLF